MLQLTLNSRTTFALSYGLEFAGITATITHSLIYFWKPIKIHFARPLREQPDIHARLMSHYPGGACRPASHVRGLSDSSLVPEWWYGCIFGWCLFRRL